jgi:hypothetical protein
LIARSRKHRLSLLAALSIFALALVPAALAGKGGGGSGGGGGGHKPGGGSGSGSGTVTLVVVSSPSNDNLPHFGGQVTYTVSTSSTTQPYVSTTCYQGTTLVLSASAGWYASYAWPDARTVTLQTMAWTGGSANCTVRLYSMDSGSPVTLGTTSFTALA